jgi:ribosomal protein L11 methyltransferase
LAILAEKLGAREAMAIDNDPWCEENARENARRNECTRVEVRLGGGEQIGKGPFDVILANINRNILLEQIPLYSQSASPQAELLLSGFYPEDEAALLECSEPFGWKPVRKSQRNGWSALHLNR